MKGIININKPRGKTSHDVVNIIRKTLAIKKVGHTGTLDPDASGVLPICIGQATKIAEFLTNQDKQYDVIMQLGITTDTYDSTGKIIEKQKVNTNKKEVLNIIKSYEGENNQTPPMYSAIRIKGQRLYELARKGIEVERPVRKIHIYNIDVKYIDLTTNTVSFTVECSKGTYIRSLCHDIGQELSCGAHMSSLIRTKSGKFIIEESVQLEEVKEIFENKQIHKILIPIDKILEQYPTIIVDSNIEIKIKNGVQVPIKDLKMQKYNDKDFYRVYNNKKDFLCISQIIKKDEDKYYLKLYKSFF